MGHYRTYAIAAIDHDEDHTQGIVLMTAEEGATDKRFNIDDRMTVRGAYMAFHCLGDSLSYDDIRFHGTINRIGKNFDGPIPRRILQLLSKKLDDPQDKLTTHKTRESCYYDLTSSMLGMSEKRRELVGRLQDEASTILSEMVGRLSFQPVNGGPRTEGGSLEKYMAQFPGDLKLAAQAKGGFYRLEWKLIGGKVGNYFLRKEISHANGVE